MALLMIAGLLCIILGLVHSVVGEVLIFRSGVVLPKRFRGIIWATWHLATLLAFALAALLLLTPPETLAVLSLPLLIAGFCMGIGSFLVLWGTKARHPGWIVLGIIALCLFIGA